MTITTFTYSKENKEKVENQLRNNVKDLVAAFSNYDFFSEEQRTEHLHLDYKAKISGIASHLDVLAEQDERLKDVKVLERFYKKSNEFDNFDLRYNSEYSGKWNEKIDVKSKINQKILDLEKILKIENSPEARFVLLNSIKYLAKKDSDNFILRKVNSSAKTLEELSKELKKDFDVIELPYNENIEGNAYFTPKSEEPRVRLKRKDVEVYFLKELRKKIITAIGNIENKEGKIEEIYDFLNSEINKNIVNYDLKNISDESLEEFSKTLGKSSTDVLIFNNLLNEVKRTKMDFETNAKLGSGVLYKSKIFARDIVFNEVKDYFMLESESEIEGDVKVNNARDCFMLESESEIGGDVNVNNARNWFMEKSKSKIRGDVNVDNAGDWFMGKSESEIGGDVNVDNAGDDFMWESKSKIRGDVNVNKAGNNFMGESESEIGGDVNVDNAGNYFMWKSKSKIRGNVNVNNAGDWFMWKSESEIGGDVNVNKARDCFMGESKSKIRGNVNVNKAGDWFMVKSESEIGGDVNVNKAGNNFMGESKSKIRGDVNVDNAGDGFMLESESEIGGDVVKAGKIQGSILKKLIKYFKIK